MQLHCFNQVDNDLNEVQQAANAGAPAEIIIRQPNAAVPSDLRSSCSVLSLFGFEVFGFKGGSYSIFGNFQTSVT